MKLATTTAILFFSGTALASDLVVGGPSGVIYRGDPALGNFEPWFDASPVASEVQAIAIDGDFMYVADEAKVRAYNLRFRSGAGEFPVAGGIQSMTLDGETLLVARRDEPTIVRLDRVSGAVLDSYPLQSFDDVHAMTMVEGEVVFGGHTTFVYRGNIDQGVTFLTACGGAVDSVVVAENVAYLGTLTGKLYAVNAENGAYYNIFNFVEGQSAMAAHGGRLLTGSLTGTIRVVNPATGAVEGSFTAPEGVTAMGLADVGCAADLDGNGVLNVFDFLSFQNAFSLGDPVADADGSGSFDVFDFLVFQSYFGEGC